MSSTDICSFFLRGTCRFGNRCWNSHNCTPSENATSLRELMGLKTDKEREQSTKFKCRGNEASTSSTNSKPHEDKPSTSSTNYKYDDGPSTSSAISKSQQNTAKEKTIQSADKAEQMDGKSSTNELIKSTEKDANKTSEIEKIQLPCNTLDRSENNGWDEILNASVSENLHCDICMEIFIRPTVLSCSHTFCGTCIFIWSKKVNQCPVCRSQIESKSYCLAIDTFIDKIIDFLPMDVKVKRIEAIKERSELDLTMCRTKMLKTGRAVIENVRRNSSRDNRLNTIINVSTRRHDENSLMDYLAEANHDDDSEDDSDEYDGGLMPDQAEVMRMNLRELVLNTGGINPLERYPEHIDQDYFRWL